MNNPHKVIEEGDSYSFDCGDADLTKFFQSGALLHQKELISMTYFFYDDPQHLAIGFFSLLNDVLRTAPFRDKLKEGKVYEFYPAVKIGRFGVDKNYQRMGIGSQMMDFIKQVLLFRNISGCHFITVDAYNKPDIINFYIQCGFAFCSDKDQGRKTRAMKFDLKTYKDELDRIANPATS
jgi:GNAT superfamily N-acetyltransferase